MFCKFCGNQIDDDAVFCANCGKKLKEIVNMPESISVIPNNVVQVSANVDTSSISKQDERAGTLIYLNDIVSLEFMANKLKEKINMMTKEASDIRAHNYSVSYPTILIPYDSFYSYTKTNYERKQNKHFRLDNENHSGNIFFWFRFHDGIYSFAIIAANYNEYYANFIPLNEESIRWFSTKPKVSKEISLTKNIIWSGSKWLNSSETCWNPNERSWGGDERVTDEYRKGAEYGASYFIECYNDFKSKALTEYERNEKKAKNIESEIQLIQSELDRIEEMLRQEYSLNIIPSNCRSIGPMYFIKDYYESSMEELSSIFFHLDLDQIKDKINNVIANQQQMIINQAIMISQNDEMIAQNHAILGGLSAVEKQIAKANTQLNGIANNTASTAKWASIAANNAEACAWIATAQYIK